MSVVSRASDSTLLTLNADEAFIGLVICAMEANGHAAPSEAARAEHIVWSMARFRRRSGAVVGALIARMKEVVGQGDPDRVLEAVCRGIPAHLRDAAFAIAADVTLVDGRLERTERQFLDAAARSLRLSLPVSESILDVIRLKNRA